ncbi:hypothetical protein [Nannocystis exedens]|uniref:hypothetical protein n=1 Tax=Nannocystis exedens TaxID=54 RepID=UPI001473FCE5|nr:hypothetical protein [Nannocystis exedens]
MSSNFECEEFDRGECGCSSTDDCEGRYCVPRADSPPALCPAFDTVEACLAAQCHAFEFDGVLLTLTGDTCTCTPGQQLCVWQPNDATGAGGDPSAMFKVETGEVMVFSATYTEPPLGWESCSDPSAPPACACFTPGETPCE